jgi:hypothetical protein
VRQHSFYLNGLFKKKFSDLTVLMPKAARGKPITFRALGFPLATLSKALSFSQLPTTFVSA